MDPPPPPSISPSGPPPAWPPPGIPYAPPPRASTRLWLWLVVGTVIAALVATVLVIGATGTPTSHPGSGTPAAGFTDPTGHFSAAFRGTPVEDDNSLSIAGQSIPYVQWTNVIDLNTSETVGYVTYPSSFDFSAPNAALDGAVTGEAGNIQGTVVSKTFGTYEGYHSVDSIISAKGGFVESRVVLAGHSLFILLTTSLQNPPELFANFAPSLKILTHG
jgi:hypothetical protein